ncbi:MAG: hypothetical protein ACR2RD_05795 [Woeseiaceae bacterium]
MRKTLIALSLVLLPLFAFAQTNEQFADMNDNIEMVRSMAELERRAVFTKNLQLSGDESADFWVLYDEYAAEKKRVNDRLVKVITDYAANYESLSDELAKSLVDDSLKVQSDQLKLKKKYLKKFRRVLAPKTVARFYQIENKLDAVSDLTMARGIPLVQD